MKFFNNVSVNIDINNNKVIHWEMEPSFMKDSKTIKFNVEMSRSGGDWEIIAKDLHSQCHFIDTVKRNYNKDRDTFYRISFKVWRKTQYSEPAQAGAVFKNRHDRLIARDMVRKEFLDLKKGAGLPGLFLRRKTWGTKCPNCLDHDTEEITVKWCDTCLGTGFVGGYYSPIEMYVKKQSKVNETKNQTKVGTTQQPDWTARCVAYPWIQTKDMWINTANNERFIIKDIVQAAEYSGVPLVYNISLKLIPKGNANIVYSEKMNEKLTENPKPLNTDNGWKPNFEDF